MLNSSETLKVEHWSQARKGTQHASKGEILREIFLLEFLELLVSQYCTYAILFGRSTMDTYFCPHEVFIHYCTVNI